MNPRVKKAIGSAVIVGFLLLYIAVASSLGGRMPDQPLVRLLYYLIAGTLWSLPLIPLMVWMNRPPRD